MRWELVVARSCGLSFGGELGFLGEEYGGKEQRWSLAIRGHDADGAPRMPQGSIRRDDDAVVEICGQNAHNG